MIYKYIPTKYIKQKVTEFAEARIDGSKNLYKMRGESKVEKMKQDIIVGTLGEYAVQSYLKNILFYPCSKPDLKIYSGRQKSFGADLTVKDTDINIHVKSQSQDSVDKYGMSWLFQRSDKLVSDPKDSEWLAFCTVNKDYSVNVIGFVHPKHIERLSLWGECKVPYFRTTKVALYLDEIQNYGIILEEL